jgi:hypothetical protein
MEKRLSAFLVLLLLADWVCAESPVTFTDDNLKAAVEAQLWVSDPTPEDMLGLTSLYAGDDDIISLTGLEYATNLTALELPCNKITSIGALSGLTNLRSVSLRSNRIGSISALSGLTCLTELDLLDNEVSDISALSGLTDLETLDLQGNGVSDLSPLSGLLRLRDLNLHRNQVSSVVPLMGLPSLKWVDLRLNPLSEESCNQYIPQMMQEHPGLWISFYPSMRRRLTLSSTAGGSVITPGEGTFTMEFGDIQYLLAQAEPGFVFANWSGSYFETRCSLFLTMDADYQMRANFLSTRSIIYVNNALQGSDGVSQAHSSSQEDGTPEYPFDQIQEAIEVAAPGASIIVCPGVYHECIDFLGKSIRVIGVEVNEPHGSAWPVIDGGGADTVVRFINGEDANSMLIGFTIAGGKAQYASAIQCVASSPTVGNCLIAGNRAMDPNGAAVFCKNSEAAFINCVVADNYAGEGGAGLYLQNGRVVVTNSIIWANTPAAIVSVGSSPYIRYSDIEDGWPGQGNVDEDPFFVKTGYWVDPNNPDAAISPANPGAVWVMGDYHLESRAGRWDPATCTWVRDRVSSPCIDAGDPRSLVGDEPFPNGGVINMGTYGGTAQACKSHLPPALRSWSQRR